MRSLQRTVTVLVFFISCLYSSSALAQKPQRNSSQKQSPASSRSLVGSIEMEKMQDKKRGYSDIQTDAIARFKKLEEQVTGSGSLTKLVKLDAKIVKYLASAYLYCSIKAGACPFILEAILAYDLYNASLNGNNSCPNMKSFWRTWVDNQMQRREEFLMPVGLLDKAANFKKAKLAYYIKCSDSIKQLIDKELPTNEFISKHFADKSNALVNVQKTRRYLEGLRKKVPNVHSATGIR